MSQSIKDSVATDHPPIFPGGMGELSRYFSTNLNLPASVAKSKFEGMAVISFIVDTDGVAVADSVNLDKMAFGKKRLSEEDKSKAKEELIAGVKQMFSSMPKWIPGIQKGVAVRVRYKLPLNVASN